MEQICSVRAVGRLSRPVGFRLHLIWQGGAQARIKGVWLGRHHPAFGPESSIHKGSGRPSLRLVSELDTLLLNLCREGDGSCRALIASHPTGGVANCERRAGTKRLPAQFFLHAAENSVRGD
jgi:hypothetical protein